MCCSDSELYTVDLHNYISCNGIIIEQLHLMTTGVVDRKTTNLPSIVVHFIDKLMISLR